MADFSNFLTKIRVKKKKYNYLQVEFLNSSLEGNYWILKATLIERTEYVPGQIRSLGDVVWNKSLSVNQEQKP